jgi:hypothetical protein
MLLIGRGLCAATILFLFGAQAPEETEFLIQRAEKKLFDPIEPSWVESARFMAEKKPASVEKAIFLFKGKMEERWQNCVLLFISYNSEEWPPRRGQVVNPKDKGPKVSDAVIVEFGAVLAKTKGKLNISYIVFCGNLNQRGRPLLEPLRSIRDTSKDDDIALAAFKAIKKIEGK